MTTTNTIEIPCPSSYSQFHLYVAGGCPFCHRVLAALALIGLDKWVSYTWMLNVKGPKKRVFFDRSPIDAVSALVHEEPNLAEHYLRILGAYRYADTVLMAAPWPQKYENDAE